MGGLNMDLTPEILYSRQNSWFYFHDYPPAPHVSKREQERFARVYPGSPWIAAFKRADRLYRIWLGMRHRCYGTGHKEKCFKYYRDKGITICDEWRHNFDAFHDWAVHHGYAEDLTIDRIDGDGNYCPENCRWVTRAENSRNKKPKTPKAKQL